MAKTLQNRLRKHRCVFESSIYQKHGRYTFEIACVNSIATLHFKAIIMQQLHFPNRLCKQHCVYAIFLIKTQQLCLPNHLCKQLCVFAILIYQKRSNSTCQIACVNEAKRFIEKEVVLT